MLDKNLQRVKISQVVGNQIPDFIAEDNPLFVEFLKQYYTSQENQGGAVDISENIDRYLNLENFQEENYLTQSTSLDGNILYYDDEIQVASTSSFPNDYGLLKIDNEIITYTSKDDTHFYGCVRGFSGVENLHKTNDPEFLVFNSSEAEDHTDNSTVYNLSNLFLQEFWKKLKIQFLPGFENRTFHSGLDKAFFLSRAKDFYASKGTDEALKILFKVLYADNAKIIKPQDFLIKPSNADWLVTTNLIVEKVSGDPTKLNGQTLIQDSPSAIGYIYNIEFYSIEGNGYYLVKLSSDSITGEFTLNGFTKNIIPVSIGDSIITVDSTLGFDEVGSLYVDGQIIQYSGKTSNQFLECTNVTDSIDLYQGIHQNRFVYSYEDGNTDKAVVLRITGTLASFDLDNSNTKYLSVGDEFQVKTLGETITSGEYNGKFDYWLYNTGTNVELIDTSSKFSGVFSPTIVTTKANHKFRRGDSITLISQGGSETEGVVSDVLYSSELDQSNNNSVQFEFTFFGSIDQNILYTARRNILTSNSTPNPEVTGAFSNVQNTYIDNTSENLYLTSTSLPSYEITATNRSKSFISGSETDVITTLGNHGLFTGEKVYLTTQSGTISGLTSEATYFVRKIDNNTFQLAFNPNRIDDGNFISYSGIGTHIITPLETYGLNLTDQKSLKKIPVVPKAKSKEIELPSTVGMFVNGVEILSNLSGDTIQYGQLESIETLSQGEGYDVITPPQVVIVDSNGSDAEAIACMSGSISGIVVTNPGFDFKEVPIVTINGGNGRDATAEARLRGVQFEIDFNGGSAGVSTSLNTIGFSTFHTFSSGDAVIYKSLDNNEIGIGSTSGSVNIDASLINNSIYFVNKIDNLNIKLMNTKSDSLTGSNPISLNQESSGTHRFVDTKIRKIIDFIQVTNPGEGYQNRNIEIVSSSYPPVFPGISTALVGINTSDDYIFAKRHGFETGEEIIYSRTGSAISGLSTEKIYYALKLDSDKFRLVEKIVGVSTFTGIATASSNQLLIDNDYVKLSSIGSGVHTFKYTPITINIDGITNSTLTTGISTQATAFLSVRGVVKDIFLTNGGYEYGSQILNFNRKPTVTVTSGSGAILQPRVVNGQLVDVFVLEQGSEYVSTPELIVDGDGKFARLEARVVDGAIESVQIIDSGKDYNQDTTSIQVLTLGSGAKFEANIQKWKVNSFSKYPTATDDGVIIPSFNSDLGSQFVSIIAPKRLRRTLHDNLNASLVEVGINTVHSPIIGWAYDGNPIYGPYGGSSETSSANPKQILSSYTLVSKPNRPSTAEFPLGFFVTDYEYTESGDLDEYNGRFCVTPEFPNGTYAYFATKTTFPYTVNKFKNEAELFNFDLLNNQSSNLLLNGTLSRNSTPYRITESNVYYSGLNDFSNKNESFIINSVFSSGISSVQILSPGSEYKIGDNIIFDDGGTGGRGASGEVDSLVGKNVTSITSNEIKIDNLTFSYDQNTVTAFSTSSHGLANNQILVISGISSSAFKEFEGSFNISVPDVSTSLLSTIGNSAQTGIVTTITLSESATSGRLLTDDTIVVGSEKLLILNINTVDNSYRVQRAYDGTVGVAHSAGDVVTLNPRSFSYSVPNIKTDLVIRENKTTYFDPLTSVGLGTTGSKYFIGYGVSFTSTGITTGSTTRIFFNSHSFQPSDFIQITNGTPAGINTSESRITSIGSTFINIQFNSASLTGVGLTFNVLKKNFNFVVAKSIFIPCLSCGCESSPFQTFEPFTYSSNSGIGITVSEYDNLSNSFTLADGQLIFATRLSEASDTIGIRTTRSGIGSLSTLYIVGIGSGSTHKLTTVNKNITGTATKFETTVVTDSSHGISTSNVINLTLTPNRTENAIVKYNELIDKIVINPVSFASTSIGIGTTVSTINISSHNFKNGDKVVYTASSPASSLVNGNSYYVIKDSNDFIRLANTYAETLKKNPTIVAITTTGSGNHEISLINPRIEFTRGNTVGFAVSDLSLSNFKLRFYLDQNLLNEYSLPTITRSGIPGNLSTSTKVNLSTNISTPEILYYALTQEDLADGQEYKISQDRDVKDFSKILINSSLYNNEFVVSGIGSTSFTLNLNKKPEHSLYNQSNTSIIKYTTSSTSASGGINKVKLFFGGVGYRSLPAISNIVSDTGSSAILRSYSDIIGKIKSASSLNVGYNYSADTTIVPKSELPTILRVKDNFIISQVGISSGGSGYLTPPTPIVIENSNIILETKLSGSSVSRVNILISDGGLPEITPTIVSTNNSNGVSVTNAESSGSFNTLTLKRPNNGFVSFPFSVGDQIFVEGVILSESLTQGGGYNSSDYNYQNFEITSFLNDANVSSVTYQRPVGLGTTGGNFDTNNSFARVIKDSDLAKFNVVIQQQNFNEDEIVNSTSGVNGTVIKNGWNPKTKILKLKDISGVFDLNSNINGSTSKTKATIVDVITFNGNFLVKSSTEKSNGWQNTSGFLNNSFERLQDSFYYQNFSYAIKSTTPYSTWEEPVNSLAHTAGFKNFSDLDVLSPVDIKNTIPARVSIASSEVGLLIEIDNVSSLYTKSSFDLGSEETLSNGFSKFIKFNSKKIIPYVESITNKVLTIDDISPQFSGITTTSGGNIVGITSFSLTSDGNSLLHTKFSPNSVTSIGSSILTINNHEFSTGEKLIYDPGPGGSAIGIATTNRTLSGISTTLLPTELFAFKINANSIKLSGIKTDSTVNNIFFNFTSVGIGSIHSLSVAPEIANTKALITLDNIIQSPLYQKNIFIGLSTAIGIGSTAITVTGITSITSNTLLKIDDEILKVNVVGLGSTNVLSVSRAQFNTVSTAHTVGAAASVISGDYTIFKGDIYFNSAPYGPVGLTTLNVGISTNTTFAGRIFYKNNYDLNYIIDDISSQFTGNAGTGKTFILKSNQNNISGISTFGGGIILINNIFQRPIGANATTDYVLSDDGISGITTITFTGTDRETLPRNGIINEVSIGVGTGYTTGSYPNVSLTGGFGSGAKVNVVVGTGGSVISFDVTNRGIGYKINDILSLSSPSVTGIGSTCTFRIISTYADEFSGWIFGELVKLDDFSNKFNGIRKLFPITRTTGLSPEPYSIEKGDGSDLVLQNNLIVFINDVLQIPEKDYKFTSGTNILFTSAPTAGSKLKFLFYQGSTSDVVTAIPLQSVKVGDELKLELQDNVSSQIDRLIVNLSTSDKVETFNYNDVGISTNPSFIRPLTWTKQTSDLIIDGDIVNKSRNYLEPRISPTTRIIKDFSTSDFEIYVQNAYPDFRIIDETQESDNNIKIIKDIETSAADALVANVSSAGTITSLVVTIPGSGYVDSPEVAFYSRSQIKEIGKTWSVGVTTTISNTNLKDIQYRSDNFIYVVCDDNGGISTSNNLETWKRTTPSFTTNNQLNSLAYGDDVWVGVGSDAKVGYSTDNASNWNPGIIYLYYPGTFGRFEFAVSTTTRKLNSVAYGSSTFVAVGSGGSVFVSDYVYPQAINWLNNGIPITEGISGIGTAWLINANSFVNINGDIISNVTNTLNSVIYSDIDSRFVVVGNNGVIMSSLMGNITNRQFRVEREPNGGYANLNDIVYGNNKYVVVGDGGAVGYSTALIGPWTINSLATSNNLLSVTFVGDVFVAAGGNGVVANSINGIDWFLKSSVTPTIFALTNNGNSVIGVGSTSQYLISSPELSDAAVTANVSAGGSISSITVNNGGFGYISTSDIGVIISPPTAVYENIDSVNVIGDYGKLIGIGTSASGISTTTPMIIFTLQSDVGLNTTKIGSTIDLNPLIARSGISTGDYFVAFNTITGTGVTSIYVSSGITTVGIGTSFIDNIYRADQVINNGVSGIVTVFSNVVSVVGVASTSVTVDKVGLDTTGKVGNYSWGKLFNFSTRIDPKTFSVIKTNGFTGIQTSPLVIRRTPLKAQYEN